MSFETSLLGGPGYQHVKKDASFINNGQFSDLERQPMLQIGRRPIDIVCCQQPELQALRQGHPERGGLKLLPKKKAAI